MHVRDDPAVRELIDRLVRDADLPDARAREDLRRELASHFEEAGRSPDLGRRAVERFGDTTAVAEGFRRAYGPRRILLYVTKVIASILASAAVALLLQGMVSLRLTPGLDAPYVSAWFEVSARVSMLVVLLGVAAWELDIDHLCTRLERRPVRLLTTYLVFFTGAYVTHQLIDHVVTPGQALVGTATTLAVWICTIAIVSRVDLAFVRRIGTLR
jgi:hypothetical protein